MTRGPTTLAHPRSPAWAQPAVILPALAAVAMVPWIGYLAATLPGTYAATDWDAAWIGFDALLVVLLAATGWLTFVRHPARVLAGFGAAMLLLADAWFDVTTATGSDQWGAIVTAVVLELPLAAYLGYRATRALALMTPTAHGESRVKALRGRR